MTIEFKKHMRAKFDMTDLGQLSYYFGIEVTQILCKVMGSIAVCKGFDLLSTIVKKHKRKNETVMLLDFYVVFNA